MKYSPFAAITALAAAHLLSDRNGKLPTADQQKKAKALLEENPGLTPEQAMEKESQPIRPNETAQ